jgi:two-component system, chemotaxis family, chemotaxis protein CheY
MNTETKYIIVDDDPLNNAINSLMLKRTFHDAGIETFALPREGLGFIQNNISSLKTHLVLFLDINMPVLTGWDFLEHYENFGEEIKKRISIYMLSSSINPRDRDKAKKYGCIKGFVSKPLTTEAILIIAENEFSD